MAMSRTDKVVAGATVGLLLYEGWTLINKRKGDTISESIWGSMKRHPLVPFGFGMLMGHFFWQKAENVVEKM